MGDVYRGRDTKLRRDVAIKVLSAAFATDADRCARFEREARLIAALNHPHIAAIYGIEDAGVEGASRALVLELVEGETLEERIHRGPLSWRETLELARQIADALDAAHEKGIVHRDLKPANIKVTPDGVVKVLDFGIAKALEEGAAAGSATVTEVNSRIVGTAAYMSPEQARGGRVDKRTDIWAFGCIVFEMLSGRRAFGGDSVTDTLAHVIGQEPDWGALPKNVPKRLILLLQRCLAKDPRHRLRDVGDLHLDDVIASPAAGALPPRRRLGWLGGAVLGAALVGGGAWLWPREPAVTAAAVNLRRLTDFIGLEQSPALSPDGRTVAFVARSGGHRQIFLRLLAGGSPLQITHGAIDHEEPRWSPDSSSLIYFTPASTPGEPGIIWEVSALGGEPRRITSAVNNGDISRDGRYLAVVRFSNDQLELATMTRDGGGVVRSQPLELSIAYSSPRWSPDGRWIALHRSAAAFDEQALVIPAEGGDLAIVARSSRLTGFSWLGDSSGIVYSSAAGSTVLYPPTRNLRAVNRDGTNDRQLTFGDISYVQPDVLASGVLAAVRVRVQSDIWRLPTDGSPAENVRAAFRVTRQTGQAQAPSVSPDGTEIAYLSDSGGHGNVWIAKADGSSVRQVTFEQDPDVSIGVPVWSPTSAQIAVIVSRGGQTGLALVQADGSGLRTIVPEGISAAWTADGRWLYYSTPSPPQCLSKLELSTNNVSTVRCDNVIGAQLAPDGATLYALRYLTSTSGMLDSEIWRASPETGPPQTLARISGARVPDTARQLVPVLSNDGSMLVMPLIDGDTTNIFVLSTAGGPLRPITDFGDRAVLIARRVAWSPDARYVYAPIADTDSDIVVVDGLLTR
jgi:Tol biopolymer transport system component